MKPIYAFALAPLALATLAVAADQPRGTIAVTGTGEISAAPEYASLRVSVTSICYDTSRAAKDANAVLATKLVAVLHNFAKGPKDRVTAAGGPNLRQTETVYVGGQAKTLCTSKWRASNALTIQLAKIEDLSDLQDQILTVVDQGAANPDIAAQTYAELGQPDFHIYDETMVKLRSQAQVKAYDDAKIQFDTFASRCAFKDPQLTSIAQPDYSVSLKADGVPWVAGAATPIIPDELSVTATWKFQWSYTPVSGCWVPPA